MEFERRSRSLFDAEQLRLWNLALRCQRQTPFCINEVFPFRFALIRAGLLFLVRSCTRVRLGCTVCSSGARGTDDGFYDLSLEDLHDPRFP